MIANLNAFAAPMMAAQQRIQSQQMPNAFAQPTSNPVSTGGGMAPSAPNNALAGVDSSTPEWQATNLVTIKASNGETWQVDKKAAPSFQAFISDLEAKGYNPKSSGGYNYRNIRGSNRLSEHATGDAIDINAATNALGSSETDMPPDVSQMAAKYGLVWGGDWKTRPDPMHFQWSGQ